MGFSVWNKDVCLSWDETLEWFELLDIIPVNVIYRGIYDEKLLRNIKLDNEKQEGYVVRLTDAFNYGEEIGWRSEELEKVSRQFTKEEAVGYQKFLKDIF